MEYKISKTVLITVQLKTGLDLCTAVVLIFFTADIATHMRSTLGIDSHLIEVLQQTISTIRVRIKNWRITVLQGGLHSKEHGNIYDPATSQKAQWAPIFSCGNGEGSGKVGGEGGGDGGFGGLAGWGFEWGLPAGAPPPALQI